MLGHEVDILVMFGVSRARSKRILFLWIDSNSVGFVLEVITNKSLQLQLCEVGYLFPVLYSILNKELVTYSVLNE